MKMVKRNSHAETACTATALWPPWSLRGKLKAKTILVSGESFDPASKHFTDQAEGYLDGKFKDIYFYKADVLKHAQREYQPGQ